MQKNKGVLMDKATGEPLKIGGEQVRSETPFIPENPSGTVIFADKGLSGTSTKKRGEFNRMIKLCRRG